MKFGKLKERAGEMTRTIAESERAQGLRQSQFVTALKESDAIQTATDAVAGQLAHFGPNLRGLVTMDDRVQISPEALLLLVVKAVRGDGEVECSLKDLRGTGKRNERLAGVAGLVGGTAGCLLADLYCDTALYCLLSDCLGLQLSAEDIAAHLLVAWNAAPDVVTAQAAMDPNSGESVAAIASRRFNQALAPSTKMEALAVLWRLRSGALRLPLFSPATVKDIFRAGRALQQRLDAAAVQLGIPLEDVRKPGLLGRQSRDSNEQRVEKALTQDHATEGMRQMGFFKRTSREAADYSDPAFAEAALPTPEATSPAHQQGAMPAEVEPAPSAPDTEPSIRPLAEGEERLLNTIYRPDGEHNEIYLTHRRPTDPETTGGQPLNFVAIVRYSDGDPNDTSPPHIFQSGPDERTIYIRVAEAAVNYPSPPGGSRRLDPDVQWFVDRIREQNPGPSPMEAVQNWAHLYAATCQEVVAAANACLGPANRSINAQSMLTNRPYEWRNTPESFFTDAIARSKQELAPLYEAFEQACSNARETAGKLLAAGRDSQQAEMVLAMQADEPTLTAVATAKSLLRAHFGPTPDAFMRGVQEANTLTEADSEDGNIYTPLPSAEPDEKTCPWCAETIKAAAVICRFCGRDVQLQPNAG